MNELVDEKNNNNVRNRNEEKKIGHGKCNEFFGENWKSQNN